MEAKEDIRSRLNIEDVIGEYVQLKRAGRNFKGMSPFSQEKTASFMVSPEKHIWHDFSSGKGGDVFSFVMELEGVDFRGAMELLARKAGVDLSQYSQGDNGLRKKKERLSSALEVATRFYARVLSHSPVAEKYLKGRKFNQKTVEAFGFGYAPTRNELLKVLMKQEHGGFSIQELRDAGLVVTRRDGPSDMFRDRLMIPLMDPHGSTIGFTARILSDEPNAPKYINTPQTVLYDKSRHVYGLHLAKDTIRQNDSVIIVEGNLDVVSSHQAGVKNVVATAGTAITEHHLRALGRFTQDVRLAFDADKAGITATERAISIASNMGISLSIIVLPDGAKDPDELIQKDVTLWQAAIDTPKDAVEWLLDVYAERFNLQTADGKRRATDQALAVVRAIEDPVLREHYLQKIAERIGSSLDALNAKLHQQPEPTTRQVVQKSVQYRPTGPDPFGYQDHLLALAWVYPELRDSLAKLAPDDFAGGVRQTIAATIQNAQQAKVSQQGLQSDELQVKIGELELIVETKYPTLTDAHYFEAVDIAKRIKKEHKIIARATLATAFNETEDSKERSMLSKQIKQLDKDIEALKH